MPLKAFQCAFKRFDPVQSIKFGLLCLFLSHSFEGGAATYENKGFLGLTGVSYVNPYYETGKTRNIPLYEGQIESVTQTDILTFGLNIEGQFSPEASHLNTFTINEFYSASLFELTENTVMFGRHKQGWSAIDQELSLGVVEPYFNVDPLRAHSQGLTGLFISLDRNPVDFTVFASSIYLPNQGPSVETQNGNFIEGHPWVTKPPSTIYVRGVPTPALYNLNRPSATEVLLQESFGAQINLGDSGQQGFSVQASYLNKPMNQLAIAYTGGFELADDKAQLLIDLQTQVVRHRLSAIDLAYREGDLRTFFSVVDERPEQSKFGADWTFLDFTPAQLYGIGVIYGKSEFEISVSGVHRERGESQLAGRWSNSEYQVLPERFTFKDLISTQVKLNWKYPANRTNQLWVRWTQEISERTDSVSVQLDHTLQKNVMVNLGWDALKSTSDLQSQVYSDIAKHISNDRFYGGFSYVF